MEVKEVKKVDCSTRKGGTWGCEIESFDGSIKQINTTSVLFGGARGLVTIEGTIYEPTTVLKINFAKDDNATCERFGRELRCREHMGEKQQFRRDMSVLGLDIRNKYKHHYLENTLSESEFVEFVFERLKKAE